MCVQRLAGGTFFSVAGCIELQPASLPAAKKRHNGLGGRTLAVTKALTTAHKTIHNGAHLHLLGPWSVLLRIPTLGRAPAFVYKCPFRWMWPFGYEGPLCSVLSQ